MALPRPIAELLQSYALEYTVISMISDDPLVQPQQVNSQLLLSGKELLQVLYPAQHLLDLQRVQEATGKVWQALTPGQINTLCSRRSVASWPALPDALGVPALVDNRLVDQGDLVLASGQPGQYLSMNADQFSRLLGRAQITEVAVALDGLQKSSLDTVDDIAQITHAIATFTQLRIKQRLEDTLELPPLPEAAQRIIRLRADPRANIQQLTDIVELDPALAAQVVSWAASPYYAAPGKIKSVHDAIVRVLGFDLVLNLALGLALGKTLKMPEDCGRGFTPYWQQAVYAAATMEALVRAMPPARRPSLGMAYLIGLLHNLGYLVVATVFPPQFSQILRTSEANPGLDHAYIERHLLGVTREQIAGWLMRLWQMPDEVVVALRQQGNADYQGEHAVYNRLIHTTLRLLRTQGIGDGPLEPLNDEVLSELGLTAVQAREALERVIEGAEELKLIAASLAA